MFVICHINDMEIPDARIAFSGLVHGNDIVIYTYEIQQLHVTFYWVRTCK